MAADDTRNQDISKHGIDLVKVGQLGPRTLRFMLASLHNGWRIFNWIAQ